MKYNTETFIERAKKVHGDLYDYSRVNYERSTKKVEIICPVHGSFFQRPENHINQKQHCPQCANGRKGKHSKFSLEWMMEHPERAYAPAVVFVQEVKGKTSNYIEVGVSTRSIKTSYKVEATTFLLYVEYMSLKQALMLEEEIENRLHKYALKTVEVFSGKTKRLQPAPQVRKFLERLFSKN